MLGIVNINTFMIDSSHAEMLTIRNSPQNVILKIPIITFNTLVKC